MSMRVSTAPQTGAKRFHHHLGAFESLRLFCFGLIRTGAQEFPMLESSTKRSPVCPIESRLQEPALTPVGFRSSCQVLRPQSAGAESGWKIRFFGQKANCGSGSDTANIPSECHPLERGHPHDSQITPQILKPIKEANYVHRSIFPYEERIYLANVDGSIKC